MRRIEELRVGDTIAWLGCFDGVRVIDIVRAPHGFDVLLRNSDDEFWAPFAPGQKVVMQSD